MFVIEAACKTEKVKGQTCIFFPPEDIHIEYLAQAFHHA